MNFSTGVLRENHYPDPDDGVSGRVHRRTDEKECRIENMGYPECGWYRGSYIMTRPRDASGAGFLLYKYLSAETSAAESPPQDMHQALRG